MKRLTLSAIFYAALCCAANVYVNPVCVHALGMLGAPIAPSGDFVQVFVTAVNQGDTFAVTLTWATGRQTQIVTSNSVGAVAIFHVEHGATGFQVNTQTLR